MSKLDELIQKYCPNGVEYKRFDEVCSLHARIGWQRLTKSEHRQSGDYMLITGTDFTSSHEVNFDSCVYVSEERYEQDKKLQLKNGDILVTKDGTLGKIAQVKNLPKPATLNGGVFVVRPKDDNSDSRFILHYLLSNHFMSVVHSRKTGSTISHLTQGLFSQILIPVPPLPVQEEIVRILDKFTELEAGLEAGLEAELDMRKKQYEYYRDKMLSLSDYDGEVEEVSLGNKDYFTSIVGGDVPKDAFSDIQTEDYSIPIYSNGVGDNALYGWTNKVRVDKPCITLSARGTIGYCAYRNLPFYPIVRLIALLPKDINKINAKFLYYAVSTLTFVSSKSGIAQLTVPMLDAYKIKVPDITEQKRIVEILDKFSTLTSDISEGLPAEIKMRHQQYEYYRDKLLSFKRLEVA